MCHFFISCLIGLVLAGSWSFPLSWLGLLLGWFAAFGLAAYGASPFRSYVIGCIAYSIAFCWLTFTIKYFAGFPEVYTVIIFMLFVFGSALQFPLAAFFTKFLPASFKSLRYPVAWFVGEQVMFRIFPWTFGHTQIAFTTLASSAALVGAEGITFSMIWLLRSIYDRNKTHFVSAFIFFLTLLTYGYVHEKNVEAAISKAPNINVAVVQANISIEERSNQRFFGNNRLRYEQISKSVEEIADLIIWPEGIIQDWIKVETADSESEPLLPRLPTPTAWIVGAMTYDIDRRFYNSSLFIAPSGKLVKVYHKQILMPFGEYIPFSYLIGWIGKIADKIGGLSAGNSIEVVPLSIPVSNGNSSIILKVAPLICYEDVLPWIATEATNLGAQILVNQTNDSWFGVSNAAKQHHQIAAFRSIENGRALVRSTNSGFTSIILPNGSILGSIKEFSESVLISKLPIVETTTPFQKLIIGKWYWRFSLFILLPLIIFRIGRCFK